MRCLPLCLVLLALAGCSTLKLEIGEGLEPAQLETLAAGHTQRAEVLARLGPPSALAEHAGGVAFLYEHVRLTERQLGLGLDFVGTLLRVPSLALLKFSFGDSGAQRQAVLLLFDAQGTLRDWVAGDWDEVFGSGSSLQLFVAVQQVVDSGSLRAAPLGLTWGSGLLELLPVVQNQPQREDLELRGTPDGAGQRALELDLEPR